MAFRDNPLQDGRGALVWTAAGATVVAIVVAFILLVADKRDHIGPNGYGAARNEFDELIEPAMGLISAPLRWLADGSTEVRGYFFAVSENRRLRARVKELERWRDAAIALKTINARYEALMQLKTEPPIPMVAARVVADARGPFSNARLADSGAEKGVAVGSPVMSEHGVLGRIVGVSKDASRILLLSDVDSRTPVMVERTNSRAVLTGDGGGTPRLEYLRGPEPAKDGDILLTSGDGGVFPRGLPVGVVARDTRGQWRARLYADLQAIDYVQILLYRDFGQLADLQALQAKAPPPLDPAQQAQLQAALAARAKPPPAPPPTAAPAAAEPTPAPLAASSAPQPVLRPAATAPVAEPKAKPKPKPTIDATTGASTAKPKPKPKKPAAAKPKPAGQVSMKPIPNPTPPP